MQRSRRVIAAIGAVAGMCISLGAAQSASALNQGGCPRPDQQLVDVLTAAGMVHLDPYIDPNNSHYLGTTDPVAAAALLAPLIDAQVNKNGDNLVCVDYRRPINQGVDKHWGVNNYQLTNISDNVAVGHL